MEIDAATGALAALAQETRLRIFRFLVEVGPEGVPAGKIAEHLNLPLATLSFHLNTLRQAGLVEFRRESRWLIYRANFAVMNELLSYLTENCCKGQSSCVVVSVCEPAAGGRAAVSRGKGRKQPSRIARS